MKYMGSKWRIAKHILPIILEGRKDGQHYVEPFCGGCNMIDKVPGNRIANDSNPYLIAMWEALSWGWDPPKIIEREYYRDVRTCYRQNSDKYPMHYVGWVGFMGSFRGTFFGGYTGHSVMDASAGVVDYIGRAVRNILAQAPLLDGVQFTNRSYADMIIPPNSIIYCDPPYAGVTKYAYSIDHEKFWAWCREKVAEGHNVFISEYNAPDDFVCVWEQEVRVCVDPGTSKQAVEKLFIHKSQL
ncbi:DNA adenine methylase [Bacteroides phage BK687P6]|nr:DNA adenine methylase [Bacteroides phage BK687P6]